MVHGCWKQVSVAGLLVGLAGGAWLLLGALPQSQAGAAGPVPLAASQQAHVVETAPGEFGITALPANLTLPGLYRMTGSLAATKLVAPTNGDEAFGLIVRCDHVTIDLGGHELVGADNTLSGIVAVTPRGAPPLVDLCVRNGTLRQWGAWGLDGSAVTGARLVDVCANRNGGAAKQCGGLLLGAQAMVTGCQADWNSTIGILTGECALVQQCSACGNTGSGIVVGQGSRAMACTAARNTISGFDTGTGATVQDCSASANGSWGISAGVSTTVRACDAWGNSVGIGMAGGGVVADSHAADNGRSGVQVRGEGSRIDGNHVSGNGIGLEVLARGNLLVRNSASGNTDDLRVMPGNTSGGLFEAQTTGYHPAPPATTADAAGAASKDPLDDLRPWANIVH